MNTILIAQSWRVGTATLSKPWHIIAKRADGTAGPSLTALCGTETGGELRATRTAFEDFRLDGALKRCNRCVMAHRRGGAYEVTEAPAPLDCFGRPALMVTLGAKTVAVTGVDEFGAIHTDDGTYNPGAMPALDAAVFESGKWAFARKPRAEITAAVAANDGLPLNVLPAAEGLAALEAITAAPSADQIDAAREAGMRSQRAQAQRITEMRAERLAAKVANVMSDWRGKEIVLPSGRMAVVGECIDGRVRLVRPQGSATIDAAWYPAEEIWRGLEFGTILTPDQIIAGETSIAEVNAATPEPQRFELLTEVQSADGTQWQAIATEHIMARDMDHALSLISDPDGLAPESAWRVSVYVAGNFAETVRMVYSLHLLGDAQA